MGINQEWNFIICCVFLQLFGVVKSGFGPSGNNLSTNGSLESTPFGPIKDDLWDRVKKKTDILLSYINKFRVSYRALEKKREEAYQKTKAEVHPHTVLLVAMFDKDLETMICSGTLLTDRWVLTAAHCVLKNSQKSNEILLYAGGYSLEEAVNRKMAKGSQIDTSVEFLAHPEYDKDHTSYDVAIVKSFRRFYLGQTINVLKVSEKPWVFSRPKECSFTGFGVVNLGEVHQDDFSRKTQTLEMKCPCDCISQLQSVLETPHGDMYVCGVVREPFGLCLGDSGSGLICDGKVMGVAMELVVLKDAKTCELPDVEMNVTCGSPGTISMFTNSYHVAKWINSVIKPKPTTKEPSVNKSLGSNYPIVSPDNITHPSDETKDTDSTENTDSTVNTDSTENTCQSCNVLTVVVHVILSAIINYINAFVL